MQDSRLGRKLTAWCRQEKKLVFRIALESCLRMVRVQTCRSNLDKPHGAVSLVGRVQRSNATALDGGSASHWRWVGQGLPSLSKFVCTSGAWRSCARNG